MVRVDMAWTSIIQAADEDPKGYMATIKRIKKEVEQDDTQKRLSDANI